MTQIVNFKGEWWIIDLPEGIDDCGPYAKRYGDDADNCASAALKGIENFVLEFANYWVE